MNAGKKGVAAAIVIVFIFSLALGFGLASHPNGGVFNHSYVSAKSLEGKLAEAEAEKSEIEKLNSMIEDRQKKLDFYRSNEATQKEKYSAAQASMSKAMKAAGYTSVEGPGIQVVLDDGSGYMREWESPNDIVVHDLDILVLINELTGAGAEAISINDQRLVSQTEIVCSGHTVRINGVTCARPFVFKAVGDQASLYSAMTIPGSYGSILKECGLSFEVKKSDRLLVKPCEKKVETSYMKDDV